VARPNTLTLKTHPGEALVQMVSNAEFTAIADKVLEKFASSDGAGDLFLTAGSNGNYTSIGTHVDTRTEDVGSSDISITSNTITLYQDLVTSNIGNPSDKPVTWDYDITAIRQFTDTELDAFADDIITHMVTNEAAGCYRISNTSPASAHGGTWTVAATLMDEVDKSNSNSTFLYKKITDSTTLLCRPLRYAPYTNEASLQLMTDSQIADLARAVRSRIVDNNIGKYLLQQSAPTPGTWVNVGTITDTRRSTSASSSFTGPAQFAGGAQYSGPAQFTGPGPVTYTGVTSFAGPAQFGGGAQFTGPAQFTGQTTFVGTNPFAGTGSFAGQTTFVGTNPFAGTVLYSGEGGQFVGNQAFQGAENPFFQPGQGGGPPTFQGPGVQYFGQQRYAGFQWFAGLGYYVGPYQYSGVLLDVPFSSGQFGPQGEPVDYYGPLPANFTGTATFTGVGQYYGPFQFVTPVTAFAGPPIDYAGPFVVYYGPGSQYLNTGNVYVGIGQFVAFVQYFNTDIYYGPVSYTGPAQYFNTDIYYGPVQYGGLAQFAGGVQYTGISAFSGPAGFTGTGPVQFSGIGQFAGGAQYGGTTAYTSGATSVGSAIQTISQTTLWRRIG